MEKRYDEIFQFLSVGDYPAGYNKSQRQCFRKSTAKYIIREEKLFVGKRRVIKYKEEARRIFAEFHSSAIGGHSGILKTRLAICSQFFWLGMTKDIRNWIQECAKCQMVGKPLVAPQPLQCISVSDVWELIGIDLTGPLPKTADGFQYILTATDYFSKWVEAFPLKTKTAAEVGRRLCSLIYRHSCPQRILTDQGREFVNQLNERMCSLLGIERSVTAAYHPQTNGLDEKTNDNIKRALIKLVNERQSNWDEYLEPVLFSLNSKVHTTTKYSPFILMYGREANFPSQVHVDLPISTVMPQNAYYENKLESKTTSRQSFEDDTLENIAKAQEKQKLAYGKRVQKKYRDLIYHVGDEVLLYNMRKRGRKGGRIEPDFLGPYVIKELCGKVVILCNLDGVTLKNKVNVNHLKPYKRSKEDASLKQQQEVKPVVCSIQQRPSVIKYAPKWRDITIEQSTSLNLPQSLEDRVKALWNDKDDGSVQVVVGPYPLYVSSFKTLHGTEWLVDEVIDAYLYLLIQKHQEPIHQLDAVISCALFSGEMDRLGKMRIPSEDLWLCPLNVGAHWILVIVIRSKRVIVLTDPLGNECSYLVKVLQNWSLFLNKYLPEEDVAHWSTWVMHHSNQQDSSSCGVLVLMFAKEFLKSRTMDSVKTSSEDILQSRMEIACALLQYKDTV